MSDPLVLMILGCAIATYVTRFAGHLILSRFGAIHHRVEAALNAVPAAVLMALVAPSLVTRGPAETLSILIAAYASTRVSLMYAVAIGLVSLVALRAVL